MARGGLTSRIPRLAVTALIGSWLVLGAACGQLLTYSCMIDWETAWVGGTGKVHEYRYFTECGPVSGNVAASWDADTRIAQEKMTGSYGTVSAEWVCPFDPWVRLDGQQDFSCTQNWRRGDLNADADTVQALLTSPPTKFPYSANQLVGSERAELNRRLGAALAVAPAAGPNPGVSSGPMAELAPVRTKVQVQGDEVQVGNPGAWDIDVRNSGLAAANPVDVTFDFSGSVRGALYIPPENFTCAGEGTRITCQGRLGSYTERFGPWATFTVWVIGERPGPGTLVVTVNGSRRVAEGNYADNVTVIQFLSKVGG